MKTLNHVVLFALLISCSANTKSTNTEKTEDDKAKEMLVGDYYLDDEVMLDGTKVSNCKGTYFNDGTFRSNATFEFKEEPLNDSELEVTAYGNWEVKDNYLIKRYDFEKLEMRFTQEDYDDTWLAMNRNAAKDEIRKSLKEKNSPLKIISFDQSKIRFESAKGKQFNIYKSY